MEIEVMNEVEEITDEIPVNVAFLSVLSIEGTE